MAKVTVDERTTQLCKLYCKRFEELVLTDGHRTSNTRAFVVSVALVRRNSGGELKQ